MKKPSEAETTKTKGNITARPHGPPPLRTTTTPASDGKSPDGATAAERFLSHSHYPTSEIQRFEGVAVSPGVAIARAQCLHDIPVGSIVDPIDEIEVLGELSSLEEALQLTAADLQSLQEKLATQVGKSEAAIFSAHLEILNDPALREKVQRMIGEKRLTATAALHEVTKEYEALFAEVEDEYLRERFADLRDVLLRLQRNVARSEHRDFSAQEEPIVLVARELYPSDVVALTEANIVGIVTEAGSRTSHAAILARSHGLPAVSGVVGILQQLTSNDTVIVDGGGGHVFVNPSAETTRAYLERQSEWARLKTTLAAKETDETKTADGETIELLANINGAADIDETISAARQV